MGRRVRILPPPFRRGLSRIEAADYLGISATKFDDLVADGRMPSAKQIGARLIWDVRALDMAFDALPGGAAEGDEADGNTWDRVLA